MINFSDLLWSPRQRTQKTAVYDTRAAEPAAAPELSRVPSDQASINPLSRVTFMTDPHGPGADRFRLLRMRLLELRNEVKLKTVLIGSPLPRDGKSTVAVNLATALSEGGKRSVVLVEADLHRPSMAGLLGIPPQAGLAECLESGLNPMSAIRKVSPLEWYLLQAGVPHSSPSELAHSEGLAQVMRTLALNFDWILIDTPPVVPLKDAVSLSQHADTCLLVVRAHQTPKKAVDEALAMFGTKHVMGIVFNSADEVEHVYTQYSGAYRRK